jgi:hypothetical protein
VNEPRRRQPRLLRVIAIAGLASAAFFAALPWLGCGWNPVTRGIDLNILRICTVGFSSGTAFEPSYGLPGFTGPYWGNLITSIAYVVVAVYVAVTKRF